MKVRHPRFPEVVKEVDDPSGWEASGWVRVVPAPRPRPKPRRSKYPRI